MAEKRKLQQEVEKTLKRVSDGLRGFDDLFTKVQESTSAAQRDKLEGEMKTQIKKLQRQRDQIKGWQSGTEVKEKGSLLDARKKIENDMERFKVWERELRIKAFSKEGLERDENDPTEMRRNEHRKWIREAQERLSTEIDGAEAEVEALAGRKGKKFQNKLESLNVYASRHRWHTGKLEHALRRLENNNADYELLEEVHVMVDYYLDHYSDSDFYFDDRLYSILEDDEESELDQSPDEDLAEADEDHESDLTAEDPTPSPLATPLQITWEPPLLRRTLDSSLEEHAVRMTDIYRRALRGFEKLPSNYAGIFTSAAVGSFSETAAVLPARPHPNYGGAGFFGKLETSSLAFVVMNIKDARVVKVALEELSKRGWTYNETTRLWSSDAR